MMNHKRWRKVKSAQKLKTDIKKPSIWIDLQHFSLKKQLRLMYAGERIKAFITDMFMINMPLLYLTTYVFLDGKDAFTHNQSAILACGIGYGIITSLFLAFASQTPGYKYMQIKLARYKDSINTQDSTQKPSPLKEKKLGFIRVFIRYVLWVIGTSFLIGILIGIFRSDGRCLHDILCDTCILPA